MNPIILLLPDIRSIHNTGAILRTADGFGVQRVICAGTTPYPEMPGDSRPPHIRHRLTGRLHKTALGAEATLDITYEHNAPTALERLRAEGWDIVALEQSDGSIPLTAYRMRKPTVLVAGNEVVGLPAEVLAFCDTVLEIPMHGRKESFNVSVAVGIALFALTGQQLS